jgi:dihydrofolate synthase / folylpolyglutamate synthase
MRTFEQTLEFLYNRLPMFTKIGQAAYKADLNNILALCNALDNPQDNFKSIHIAGTNGKGSTSHMLAAILQEAGYKVGLYTSPHIKHFGERIRINGEMIDERFVIEFTEKNVSLFDSIEPSFFEVTVAMAFKYFEEQQIDYAIIETGLGGLLDSTNIISPILSVITNIGLDHQNILGNTIEEIAVQKAGIIKPNTPVVIGENTPITKPIFESAAKEKNAPISFAEQHYKVIKNTTEFNKQQLVIESNNNTLEITTDLQGSYQLKNICTVLQATTIFKQIGIEASWNQICNGLANVKKLTGLRGRWEVLQTQPIIIADVGHNEDGIKQILNQLNNQYPNAHYHFIMGFVKDKDVSKVLSLLPKNATYYFTQAQIPRALNVQELNNLAQEKGLFGEIYENVNEALAAAKANAKTEDVVIICGSFFIIAELDIF